jgi:hypothetical protein
MNGKYIRKIKQVEYVLLLHILLRLKHLQQKVWIIV